MAYFIVEKPHFLFLEGSTGAGRALFLRRLCGSR
jgi:ABC-type ATPase involved in cell division